MTAKATITYSVVTPESVDEGDVSEHGWWLPGGWEHPLEDSRGFHEEVLEESMAGEFDISIEEAVKAARDLGAVNYIDTSFGKLTAYSVDCPLDRANIEDGEEREYTLHIEGVSEAELQAIKELLQS